MSHCHTRNVLVLHLKEKIHFLEERDHRAVQRLAQVQPEIESLKEVVASLKRHIDTTERHVNTSEAPAHRAIRHLMVHSSQLNFSGPKFIFAKFWEVYKKSSGS